MRRMLTSGLVAAVLAGAGLSAEPEACPPPIIPLAVRVVPVEPTVTLRLGEADAQAVPSKHGCATTGGGNIDVRQPTPDTIVITMTGVAVAGGLPGSAAGFNFDLNQKFSVVFETPTVCGATLSAQARVIGLLRNPCKGSAACSDACVSVAAEGEQEVLTVVLDGKSIGDKDNQSVLVRKGPVTVPIVPGVYTLHQTFSVNATQPALSIPGKPASAEFAPAPALDPTWISYKDPFHGAAKKDFGFQVTLKVTPLKTPQPGQPTQMKVLIAP